MYADVTASSGIAASENDSLLNIPEWKKVLIMKKRAGCNSGVDESVRRNLDTANILRNGTCDGVNNKFQTNRSVKVIDQNFGEISPPKTVTIGRINVELRSVKALENPPSLADRNSSCEFESCDSDRNGDLQYGPGIVDRLRARFLNIGVKEQKPVVRRFSSLENLPGSHAGPHRVNARGIRQNGFKPGYNITGHVKKAQSMETLICPAPEQQIFTSSRRPNARSVGGVKSRILSRNIASITVDENDKPEDKSPVVSPRLFTKSIRRWDYGRSVSAPNINEDELPKPDTVKQVKKIFESPPGAAANSSEKPVAAGVQRYRYIPSTTNPATSTPPSCNSAIVESVVRPVVKKIDEEDAKPACAKDIPKVNNAVEQPDSDEEKYDDFAIVIDPSPAFRNDNDLSANRSREIVAQEAQPTLRHSPEDVIQNRSVSPEVNDVYGGENLESPVEVTPEQLPLPECVTHSSALSQGSPLEETVRAEQPLEGGFPRLAGIGREDGMVVAAATAAASGETSTVDSFGLRKGVSSWQTPPQSTTSVVFDFRDRKDVEPHISLNPTPFGCRPAKVSRGLATKRSGSPPRSLVNGEDEDFPVEEEWDEMDIGADLPAVSGIVFVGENVKIGRGALMEKKNKKLNIQFDDDATSVFEYPSESESSSPCSTEENGCWPDSSFNTSIAMGSSANSRIGLSNYTPQVLSSNEFEFGVSQSNHRPTAISPDKIEKIEDVPILDVLLPASPDETSGWSATETADILF